jgi:hypothetical protein
MNDVDTIGVVREHRWIKADEQAKRLEADGCRIIVTLNGGKRLKEVTRAELSKLTRPGTVLKFVHAFLLADPRKRYATAIKGDLIAWVRQLVDQRGGIIKDVDTGLTTERPEHRRAVLALAFEQIGLSRKGAKSAMNGRRMKGRQMLTFTSEQMKDAKAAWRNVKDYPTWSDVAKALPEKFTTARAYKLFGKRL